MAPIPSQAGHSHRSTTKINQKAFKTKHLSKGALKEKAKGAAYRIPFRSKKKKNCMANFNLVEQVKSKV